MQVPGVSNAAFYFDIMHCFCQGVVLHAVGNALHTWVYTEEQGPHKEIIFGELWRLLQEIMTDLDLQYRTTALTLAQITKPKSPFAAYPVLTSVKAAEARHMLVAVARLSTLRRAADLDSYLVRAMLKALCRFYATIDTHEHHLPPSAVRDLANDVGRFLNTYSALASRAVAAGQLRWSVVPKHHFVAHVQDFAMFDNPRLYWTYSGEDFVGQVARIAHACLPGKARHRLAQFLCERWRIGVHLRLERKS